MSAETLPTIDREIDARGSFCPGPLMEFIRVVRAVPVPVKVPPARAISGPQAG